MSDPGRSHWSCGTLLWADVEKRHEKADSVLGPAALGTSADGPAPALDASPDVDGLDKPGRVGLTCSLGERKGRFLRVIAAPAEEDNVGFAM